MNQTESAPRKPRRVVVLINASSGSVNGKSEALGDAMRDAFSARGIDADLQLLPGDRMEAAARDACDRVKAGDLDAIVVSGGDGTIRTVAGAVADSGIPLGIVPGGTFNHFAKDLGLPLDLDAAIEVIASGHLRAIDAGEVNGQVFINNSSVGVYPYLVVDRERRRRRGLPKALAMARSVLRAVRNLPLRRLSIVAEGWTERLRSPCVFIGNNEYVLQGRQTGTRSKLDDGKLYLLVARQKGVWPLFVLALRIVTGRLNQSRDLRVSLVEGVVVTSRRRRLLVASDGEVERIRTPLQYKIRPAALKVFAPKPSVES